MKSKQGVLCLFILALSILQPVTSFCPYQCECSSEPRVCSVGVSLVMDGCNCCKVCAKQLGDQCNIFEDICDTHRNLFCDFTASRSGDWGVCKARNGRSCFHDDIVVTSGSMFKPSCKKRCWCIDGAVACVPTCPHETQIPRSDRCPNARLQSSPGQCCEQWTCQPSTGDAFTLPLENFWNEYVDDRSDISRSPASTFSQIGNGIRDGPIYEDDIGDNIDELLEYQNYPILSVVDYPVISDDDWSKTNLIPGDIDGHLQAPNENTGQASHCRKQSSAWSPCSKSCGLGVSSRVTNSNPECRLIREQRLCEIRPCSGDPRYQPKKGHQCLRHKRSRKRVTIKYAGCVSIKKMKQRYCGSCRDNARCCTPKATRTSRVRFRCEDGQTFLKNVLVVRSCHCHKNCSSSVTRGASMALHGDMHRASRDS